MRTISLRLAAVLCFVSAFTGLAGAEPFQRVTHAAFGQTRDGAEVKLITLRNSKGMSAQIINYGAIIKELHAPDRQGAYANVVLTTDTLENYERFNASAAVIGRVANRIAGAQFDLDGTTYQLTANERKNTIHGGRKGFAQRVWKVVDIPAREHEAAVKLTYVSANGEEGFPGTLTTSVTYVLTENHELRLEYEASTDQPTIVNLTNHAYFNLSDASGGATVLDHILWIPAEHYTPTNDELIPTGEIAPVKGTPLDFTKPTRIGERIEQLKPKLNGYDNNYVLGEPKKWKLAARLLDKNSGRLMEVRTTAPGMQLYTGNHVKHAGVCLETQHHPDAIHHPGFPSIVVQPGTPWKEATMFTFRAE